MFFIYFFLFILALTLVVLIIFYAFLVFGYARTGVPFIPRPKKSQEGIFELMNLKEGETLVDLGCGDATLLIAAEKKYNIKTIGYELSPAAFIIAKINIFLKKSKTQVFLKDFFKADLSQADIIFCYLFPFLMKKISENLKKELKPGARIVSLAFPLPDWPNEKKEYLDKEKKRGKIYIYYK